LEADDLPDFVPPAKLDAVKPCCGIDGSQIKPPDLLVRAIPHVDPESVDVAVCRGELENRPYSKAEDVEVGEFQPRL